MAGHVRGLGGELTEALRAKWTAALSAAEDRLAALRGSAEEAGGRICALEEQIAAKIRGYRDGR